MTKVSITNERLLTAERLRRLLSYDPETGVFTWRSPGTGRRVSGIAGCLGGTGYWHINLDNRIYPAQRLAFYDPGLGSQSDNEQIKLGIARKLYNLVSQGTGLGITKNIIDCYAAILTLWRSGDRIFLIGFSRGAYTVRCVGGVLSMCGVPTQMKDGAKLRYDPDTEPPRSP